MALGRYRVPDLPTRGAGAFLPAPPPVVTPPVLSSWGLVGVFGAPGTMPVPSPKPRVTASGVRTSADGLAMPSNVSPDVILPSIYVSSVSHMGPQDGALNVAVRHHNDMPVPAVNIIRTAGVAQPAPTKLGGKAVTPWPRALPRWPSVTQPTQSGRPRWN